MRWYKFDRGLWKCLHCDFTTDSHMGIQSHIRKHKSDPRKVQRVLSQRNIDPIYNEPVDCLVGEWFKN